MNIESSPTPRSDSADRPGSTRDGWLVSNGQVLASVRLAADRASRRRGLLRSNAPGAPDTPEGALVLAPCRWVHTIGMRRAIEVAYLDGDGRVIKAVHMRPHRLGAPVPHAKVVVEAPQGAFSRWGLRVGDTVEVRTT